MARRTLNQLTQRQIEGRLEIGKRYSDGGGLSLMQRTGDSAKTWYYRYELAGVEKLYTVGEYPAISLAAARKARAKLREQVREGINPTVQKNIERAATITAQAETFERWARTWHEHERDRKSSRWSPPYAVKVWRSLELHVRPWPMWRLPISSVHASHIAPLLADLDKHSRDTAEKVGQRIGMVFAHAAAHGAITADPSSLARRALGGRRAEEGRLPAITALADLGSILRRIEPSSALFPTRAAATFIAYVAQRPAEVCGATWNEISLTTKTWSIPRARMKVRRGKPAEHAVPLSLPALALLATIPRGESSYLFPSPIDPRRSITREALEKFYRENLGLRDRHSPHSWRAAMSTNANEARDVQGRRLFDADDVELVLDHEPRSEVARRYDRSERIAHRRAVLDWWGDQLAGAINDRKVVRLHMRA